MSERTSSASTAITLPLDRLPWVSRLARDYSHAFENLAPFYAGNPLKLEAWRDQIARVHHRQLDREAVADILSQQQQRRGAPDAARREVERLRDPRAVAVLTGQQAGAAGGPLFTLLKAMTAIRLARCVERKHGVPAVPIFWVDAEDHDWDEVASLTVLDADFKPRSLTLPSPARTTHAAVASVMLDQGVVDFVGELGRLLPATEFTAELTRSLAAAYQPGRGMADAFGRWVEHVLGDRGLILFDCSDVAAKPLVSSVFVRELTHLGRTASLAAQAGAALVAQGYHAQVETRSDGISLFRLGESRHPITNDGATLVAGDERAAPAAWADLASREPQRFSPNVLLRPIVQDTLFPTVAYVGGPSELAYLGQLKEAYAFFDVPMPLVVPRATATLMDAAAARFLAKTGVDFASLQPQDEGELNRFLQSHLPPGVDEALHAAQTSISEAMTRAIQILPALDPTLEGAARSSLGRMEHELRTLQTKVIHAAKKQDETLRRQFVRARALLFPEGHPQERTLGFVWFLNRYGPALIDVLERDLPLDGSTHVLLTP